MGHWYDKNGFPRHEMPTSTPNAKKKIRATTILDARKINLVPSVSGICDILDKTQIKRWEQDQLLEKLLVMFATNQLDIESKQKLNWHLKRVRGEFEKELSKASDFGTLVHEALESYIKNEPYETKYKGFIDRFWKALCDHLCCEQDEIEIIATESTFSNYTLGYGGSIDLIARLRGKFLVIDLKTKRTTIGKPVNITESNLLQLVGYKMGYKAGKFTEFASESIQKEIKEGWKLPSDTRIMDVFVSTTEDDRAEVHEMNIQEQAKYWSMFNNLLEVWFVRNNHDPRIYN